MLKTNVSYMYWTDWGENPMIARSGMDGSLPQKFITHDIHWPNGVHVDYIGKRIYWVDAKIQVIESAKLDASDRRVRIFIIYMFFCNFQYYYLYL